MPQVEADDDPLAEQRNEEGKNRQGHQRLELLHPESVGEDDDDVGAGGEAQEEQIEGDPETPGDVGAVGHVHMPENEPDPHPQGPREETGHSHAKQNFERILVHQPPLPKQGNKQPVGCPVLPSIE